MATLDQQLKASIHAVEPKSSIAAKLVAAMSEIDAVEKGGVNSSQGYKFVRAADVANEVRKVLVKHKIAFGFSLNKEERWQTDRFDKQSGSVVGTMNYVSVHLDFTFTDTDSGDSCVMTGIGWGSDVGDKAIYKALTGALKYCLRLAFVIPDESDPENEGNGHETKTQGEVTERAQQKAIEQRAEMAKEQGPFLLEEDTLHCIIKAVQAKTKKGSTEEFLSVTFNGYLPNGCNYASCFDKKLIDPLKAKVGKEAWLWMETRGQYINIKGIAEDVAPVDHIDNREEGALPPVEAYR